MAKLENLIEQRKWIQDLLDRHAMNDIYSTHYVDAATEALKGVLETLDEQIPSSFTEKRGD